MKPLGPERQIEAIFERVARHTSETFGKAFCIAMVTAAAELRTTRNRVPCRVCPFDCSAVGHGDSVLLDIMIARWNIIGTAGAWSSAGFVAAGGAWLAS